MNKEPRKERIDRVYKQMLDNIELTSRFPIFISKEVVENTRKYMDENFVASKPQRKPLFSFLTGKWDSGDTTSV